jgi:(p)ppGpp synthase/HD superfamily hydrolase
MSMLEKAIAIAVTAHAGQRDKAGEPYILHPLRVMFRVNSASERIVAVLHDVVEDSDWTFEQLREEGFPDEILDALNSVTKRDGEVYKDFVERAGSNAIGRQVKLADLEDNCDLSRIAQPVEKDYQRIEKYKSAILQLRSAINHGVSS